MFLFINLGAQNRIIDSLQNSLKTIKIDTCKVVVLNELSMQFKNTGDLNKSLEFGNEALVEGERAKYKRGISRAYSNIGVAIFNMGNPQEALKNYNKALSIRKELGDKKLIASSHNNIGNVYFKLGNFTEALANHLEALRLREIIGDKMGQSSSYNNMGNVYYAQNDAKKSLRAYERSLQLVKEMGDKPGLIAAYLNIGNVYARLDSAKEGLEYFDKALELAKEFGDKMAIATVYNNKSVILKKQKKFDEALSMDLASLQIAEQIGNLSGVALSLSNIGESYLMQAVKAKSPLSNELYKKAGEYCNRALEILNKTKDLETKRHIYIVLSDIAEREGKFENSLRYYKNYISCRDTLLNKENTAKTVRLEMNYEFDKKEAVSKAEQDKKDAISKEESEKQKIIIWFIGGVLLLVLFFAVFIYRSYLQKQKANIEIFKQKEIIEAKQTEILDSIHYAKRIQNVLMTSEKYIAKSISKLNPDNSEKNS